MHTWMPLLMFYYIEYDNAQIFDNKKINDIGHLKILKPVMTKFCKAKFS